TGHGARAGVAGPTLGATMHGAAHAAPTPSPLAPGGSDDAGAAGARRIPVRRRRVSDRSASVRGRRPVRPLPPRPRAGASAVGALCRGPGATRPPGPVRPSPQASGGVEGVGRSAGQAGRRPSPVRPSLAARPRRRPAGWRRSGKIHLRECTHGLADARPGDHARTPRATPALALTYVVGAALKA